MELEKMSDIELLHAYAGCNDMKLYQASEKELLKRLSKNNIEEFKKKLIEEIEKSYFIPSNKEDQNTIKKLNPLFETYKNKIINLINNIK
jgi:hypothetical protein